VSAQAHSFDLNELSNCSICRDRFANSATAHAPRPVLWFERSAKILIAGQAPGARVHQSGVPFSDPSGDRLRDWLGLSEERFYAKNDVAIVPMAFCFPGYNAKGADLPPPTVCAKTWRRSVLETLPDVRLTILVGGYAQKWHLDKPKSVSETVKSWQDHAPNVFPLPHPSWRNTGWLKKNEWFEAELIPALKLQVKKVLNG
jgi:uracil-DNA glycosylase